MAEPQTLDHAAPNTGGLDPALRVRLSVMMFLQYLVWGSWFSILGIYLEKTLGFSGGEIGRVYGTMALASIIAPMIFGQIADRWISTQYLLAGLHIAAAAMLFVLTRCSSFSSFYPLMLIHFLLYIPTITLTNSLSYHHINDAARFFPGIRVFGTIGWIAAGLIVGWTLNAESPQPLMMGGVLGVIMGVYCLSLPHTPPTGRPGEAMPFIKALGLLKDPSFAIFMIVSFITAVVLAGYYTFTGPFLTDLKVPKVAAVMTIGQVTEMVLLPFLPFFLKHIGMKWTLVMGMAAWGIRYGFFAVGQPIPLVIVALALHGICYDFFFVAGYIHVDNQATKDMRASAQAMFNLVIMGLGMLLGNEFFGRLKDHYTVDGVADWAHIWSIPIIGVVVALAVFIVGFRLPRRGGVQTIE